MKKLLTVLLAAGLVLALTLPASAFDSEFGGFWRTRAYTQKDFDGSDNGTQDLTRVDTRTRLFYTAVFSEDFKFVNQFEFNIAWGDTTGGNIGTDGTTTSGSRYSYGNFNFGPVNVLLGLQPRVLNRGFLFDDDYAGAAVTYKGEGLFHSLDLDEGLRGGPGEGQERQRCGLPFLDSRLRLREALREADPGVHLFEGCQRVGFDDGEQGNGRISARFGCGFEFRHGIVLVHGVV